MITELTSPSNVLNPVARKIVACGFTGCENHSQDYADMRNIEAQIPKPNLENLRFVLVRIDPKNDRPKRLKEFGLENKMDGNQWVFLQGTKSGVKEFANVLAVKYKEISPLDFSHSNINKCV